MSMYVVRRLLQALPLLIGISIVSFLVIQAIPGGVLATFTAEGAGARAEDLEVIKAQLGLDKPLYIQYWRWLSRFVQGDWGRTLISHSLVREQISAALPRSLLLMGTSFGLAVCIGLVLGVISAVRQYTLVDAIVTTISFVGLSMPVFWLGLILILVFAVSLGWLPGGGFATIGMPFSAIDRLRHLVLPVAAVTLPMAGEYTRYVRSSLLDVRGQDFIRTAHAKGLSQRRVLFTHSLRNALLPLVTIAGTQIPWMIGGFVVAESVFSWPGMGRLMWEATLKHDYPVMMAIMVLVSVAVVAANLLVDVVYGVLDPRISFS